MNRGIRVLDIGTGTGIWAINFGKDILILGSFMLNPDLADEHPNAEVCGVDLSSIQPELCACPPSCLFEAASSLQGTAELQIPDR